jgi:hypothetical protein
VSDGTTRSMHAWIDESVHVGNGLYLLAAAVAPDDEAQLEACRDHLRSLVRHARGRLHWRNEEEIDHIAITAAIGAMPLSSIVVTATRLDPKKQERARRKCLEQLLHRLVTDGVEQVWLESRDARGNSRDLAMVANLRNARTLPRSIRVDHARPLEEPLLWLPDSIAGAVAAAHDGKPQFRAPLLHMLEEITFEL